MLTAEQAKEALKKFEIPDWEERRSRELGGLGGRYAAIGRGMLGLRAWGRRDEKDPAVDMDALKPNERTAIFDVLFPGLGASLEAMWTAGKRMPYQWGYTRRGFRAPNDAELTREARSRRFAEVLDSLRGYAPDETWIARWAPFLPHARGLGVLLATVIDRGDKSAGQIFDLLVASARGEDEIGGMGRHVTTALLTANRPDGWTLVEELLLAAQREEGLRQAIFEAVDEAHPEAFKRMLDLIVARDLVRFTSTVRALDVWLGYMLGGGSAAAAGPSPLPLPWHDWQLVSTSFLASAISFLSAFLSARGFFIALASAGAFHSLCAHTADTAPAPTTAAAAMTINDLRHALMGSPLRTL